MFTQIQTKRANINSLLSLRDLLGEITDVHYQWSHRSGASCIGQHTRHIIDHYTNFIAQIGSSKLCYDRRSRDVMLASNRRWAAQSLLNIADKLESFELPVERPVKLDVFACSAAASLTVTSSVCRELMYLHSHILHHMAVIQLLAEMQGHLICDNFAAAPSTLKLNQMSVSENS